MRRVVITGMGIRTPLGGDPSALLTAMVEGRTGIVPQPQWAEVAELFARLGAPVSGFDEQVIPRKYRRTMGLVAQYAVASALDAVKMAGLTPDQVGNDRTAVVAGSTVGSAAAEQVFWEHLLIHHTARGVRSTLFFHGMSHTCAANVALMLGIRGEVLSTNSACASSAQAIGVAADRIRAGRADMALAGGAEELHVASAVVFQTLAAVSTELDPERAPRPFDRTRDGIVVGEGGGMVLLEERERALARGAPILGEVVGFGTTCDAENMANPDPQGMIAAIRACMRDATTYNGWQGAIDYVNAHATGTAAGDAAEAQAILDTVGDGVPVSSSKGHLGHLLGGCGVVEAIICLEAMRAGVAPPTRNLVDPDVAPVRLLTEALRAPLRTCLSTSFAFGGVNAVLLLGDEATARAARS